MIERGQCKTICHACAQIVWCLHSSANYKASAKGAVGRVETYICEKCAREMVERFETDVVSRSIVRGAK